MFFRQLLMGFVCSFQPQITRRLGLVAIDEHIDIAMANKTEEVPPPPINTFFRQRHSGYDDRYPRAPNTTEDQDFIMNITRFMKQMELLNLLKSPNIPIQTKIQYIAMHDVYDWPLVSRPNMLAGGLYKDWDTDIGP
jgi:hypothetical protein